MCYVIGVVHVRICLCGLFYTFLFQLETVIFHFINRRSKHVVWAKDKGVCGWYLSLQHTRYNVKVVCVSIQGVDCFHIASFWLRRFLWVSRRRVVFAPFSLCLWSQRLGRSRQIMLLPLGFLLEYFRRIVKICNAVDRFLRKPFWLFKSIMSILGSLRLRSRAAYILVTMD